MNFWQKAAGFVGSIFGSTATGAAAAGVSVAKQVSDIVETWAPGVEKKQELSEAIYTSIANSVAAARAADVPGNTGTWFDAWANGLNRLVRPSITYMMIAGLYGWVPLPRTGAIEPIVLYWIGGLFTYWFGVRTLFKDIPETIAYLRNVTRK